MEIARLAREHCRRVIKHSAPLHDKPPGPIPIMPIPAGLGLLPQPFDLVREQRKPSAHLVVKGSEKDGKRLYNPGHS
ncbi:MAG: hypothetical protein AB2L22_08205 [Syntrophales bacterium]